ncbi:MAG: hypothetical protein WCS65_17975 [Verrucomicrobiae bacterium]
MAATSEINTPSRPGSTITVPVAAATNIFAGTLVALDAAGRAVPAADTAGLRVIGRAEASADNSLGAADAITVDLAPGVFRFANSAGDAVDANDIGKDAFVEDDMTVCETGATHKVKAGRVVGVDSLGVWVDTTHAARVPSAITLGSTNGTAGAAADLAALKAEAELIGDDVRAIFAALQAQGILK